MARYQVFIFTFIISLYLAKSRVLKGSQSYRFDQLKTRLLEGNHRQPANSVLPRSEHVERFQITHSQHPRPSDSEMDENRQRMVKTGELSFSRKNASKNKHRYVYRTLGRRREMKGDVVTTDQHQMWSDSSNSLLKRYCDVKGKYFVCYVHGLSVCHCRGELADCSGKRFVPNIPYIPKLPSEIKCLIFQHNNVQNLDESYFANVTHFKAIDFSSNKLRKISRKTFARFYGSLEYLILNYNSLTYSDIAYVLAHPPSIRLDVVGVGISQPIPKNFFRPFAEIPTSELHFDYNFIPEFNLTEFSVLNNLKYLSAENCSIRHVIASAVLRNIQFLNLKNNFISEFPPTCLLTPETNLNKTWFDFDRLAPKTSMFPKLKELRIKNGKISEFPIHTDLCLPKLELLFLSLNNISTFRSYSLKSLPELRELYLDHMKSNISLIESHAFASQSLASLHLSRNAIEFGSDTVSSQVFQDCPHLDVLHLDHNNFSRVHESEYLELFKTLPRLRYLYMGSSQMTFIPSKAFSLLNKVNKLYLYLNKITTIPTAAFDSMTTLQYLSLDENKITTIAPGDFSPKTIKRLRKIDLSKNNYQCNCDLLWFQAWLKKAGSEQFADNETGYACADRPGTMVTEFVLSKQACLYSQKTYILFTVCLSIVIVLFVLCSILYHYRWHIRLALYKYRPMASGERPDHLADPSHDVFIVYCNDDSPWVIDELLHRVEKSWNLSAFVHERDFEAGRMIIDNIVLAMNTCRHILVVLSSRFVYSSWCNLELQLCQSHVTEHDLPSLLVVQLEPIQPQEMTRVVVALRSSTTFLEWPQNQNQRDEDVFWCRLERNVRQMKGPNRCNP